MLIYFGWMKNMDFLLDILILLTVKLTILVSNICILGDDFFKVLMLFRF